MAHRQRSPSLPGTLDRPDAGFMAAAGAYVAAVLVAISIALAVAMGASTAAIVGSLSTAITVGLVAGGVAAGRIRGLPERLGRGWRRLALPFVVPLLFATVATLALAVPSAPNALAFGTGFGAAITLFAALVIDVRLTDAELRIERPRRRDIRCARAVIDDPKRVREEIERARDGAGRARTVEEVV